MADTASREPKDVLAGLLRLALDEHDWTAEDAAAAAAAMRLKRLSANNIRAYAEGKRKRVKAQIVSAFERLFGLPKNTWASQVFSKDQDQFLLRTKLEVLEEQQQLGPDDEVWIISSRDFLEAADADIKKLVCSAISKGVVYKYFFPAKDGHPYGTVARDSYRSFRNHIHNVDFESSPQVFGFALDPRRFSFFSKLHTIVRYKQSRTDKSSTYCFIEIGHEGDGKVTRWYRLPMDVWPQIENELESGLYSVADSELEQVRPINPRLRAVGERYVSWFDDVRNANHYSNLRGVIAHSADRCTNAIVKRLLRAEAKAPKSGLRYLDIGCGDGIMTAAIAKALQRAGKDTSVTIIDPSEVQIGLATQHLGRTTHVSAKRQPFEEFVNSRSRGEFEVITAIHSLYTVDDAFLPRIYELLTPGGVACIWMGALADNVVNSLANGLDAATAYGQRRNYAEDVDRILSRSMLRATGYETHVAYLDAFPNDAACEEAIFRFCALQNVNAELPPQARGIWDDLKKRYEDKLPMTDLLIALERPNR